MKIGHREGIRKVMELRSVIQNSLLACIVCVGSVGLSQELRVELIKEAPVAEGLAEEVAAQMAEEGFRVLDGTKNVCEIWPAKQWKTTPGFEPTLDRLYPFEQGELIGLLRFRRRGSDFRDQKVKSGWYTMRYALQPTDGNHVGTSPTRDFVLLVGVDADKSVSAVKIEELLEASAAAAGSSHPAMLCLQRHQPRSDESGADGPSAVMRHNAEQEWWILQFSGKGAVDGKESLIPVDLIVAGHAEG